MGMISSKYMPLDNGRKFSINIERYMSADDVVKDCKSRKKLHSGYKDYSTYNGYYMSFHGVESYDEALDLLKNGYQDSVDKLKQSMKLSVSGNGKRIAFKNDVAGFAPVVPLALKGVPQSMISTTIKPIKCKVVDVYYDMTCPSRTSSDTIIKNGQAVLSAISELEAQGYRFNLYAVQCYTDNATADVLCVKVKSSDKPLDIKRLSTPLTHPSFFRVIGFDWISKTPNGKYRDSYGFALRNSIGERRYQDFAKTAFGDNAVFISCASMTADEKWLTDLLTGNENKKK